MNKLYKLILSPIYLTPIFSVSGLLKIVDDKVKLNKDSSISIDESDYKQLIRMYVPYYNKLGFVVETEDPLVTHLANTIKLELWK